jgi:sulfide dehydrogenase cytochrome subunit
VTVRMRVRLSTFLLPIAGLTASGTALGDPAQQDLYTRALVATCANCHGSEGRAAEGQSMMSLAGLEQQYISQQMRAFRDGQRQATVMHQLAKGFSIEQIDAMAAYFSTRK